MGVGVQSIGGEGVGVGKGVGAGVGVGVVVGTGLGEASTKETKRKEPGLTNAATTSSLLVRHAVYAIHEIFQMHTQNCSVMLSFDVSPAATRTSPSTRLEEVCSERVRERRRRETGGENR